MTAPIKEELTRLLSEALRKIAGSAAPGNLEALVASSFEIPREPKFGEISSTMVLRLAKELRRPPRPLAEALLAQLEPHLARPALQARVSKIAVEGPGFVNFYYSAKEITQVLPRIRKEGGDYGRPRIPSKKILLEFVSANPTGPLTVAHGRQAALGDSLALILAFCGHRVTREYYNNDEGVQIHWLGRSIRSRVLAEIGVADEFPEEGYQGEYIRQMAKALVGRHGEALRDKPEEFFSRAGKESILEGIKKDLKDFGVLFDRYFSQEVLMKSGKVEEVLGLLKSKGFVYEKDGAVWFESTRFGDDKDRVLVKSDKATTYLLPDIAYHRDKLERGYDLLVNILGPDHHGYILRIKAAVEALGYPRERLEILIAQLVTLFEGDKTLRMSTRAGEFVTLREILDAVGKDAGRFFFLMRKFDAHLDFDLALAKSQTPENPVFYIQYAHARIESVKKLHREKGLEIDWEKTECLERLTQPEETELLRRLVQFEDVVLAAAKTLEPYRLVPYLQEVAGAFHKCYAANRVITEEASLTQARMMLLIGTQQVIRSGLELLGVSAPVKM
ncbi:MAG: arginine--tRNA ligase [Candidatus Omnitrophica bacterium]|nr:arginine--tRNA ligase [Candidatus Omnitrophota bacterium]